MLRDKNLVPLSQQHQHALALCVRIERALRNADKNRIPLAELQGQVEAHFSSEMRFHFQAEEQILFPAALRYGELQLLVEGLLSEHETIRSLAAQIAQFRFAEPAGPGAHRVGKELLSFASALSSHVRKEERQLFEGCQKLMNPAELQHIGADLEEFFRATLSASCSLRPRESRKK
jgi:hemerythrin-like domain-containing protein